MASPADALGADDRALLERLATRIVDLRLEVPAILTLETGKPLALLASQTLTFFEPIVQSLFHLSEYRRFAALAERRDALEALIVMIEARADARSARGGAASRP